LWALPVLGIGGGFLIAACGRDIGRTETEDFRPDAGSGRSKKLLDAKCKIFSCSNLDSKNDFEINFNYYDEQFILKWKPDFPGRPGVDANIDYFHWHKGLYFHIGINFQKQQISFQAKTGEKKVFILCDKTGKQIVNDMIKNEIYGLAHMFELVVISNNADKKIILENIVKINNCLQDLLNE